MSYRPLTVAIIGGGFMATVHAHAARAAGAQVLSILASSKASTQKAADSLRIPIAAESLDEILLDPEVDVVHVCTPNATHASLTMSAIHAGKHIVCEKPLGTSVDEARAVTQAAAAAGVTATVPFVYRFHPLVREARARVLRGESGEVLTVAGTYLQDWLLRQSDTDWRVDETEGGPSRAFADIGSHLVDLIEFVTDDRIARLHGTTRTVFTERPGAPTVTTEDLAGVLFQSKGGIVGTLLVSQVAPGRKNALTIEVHGTRESIRFEQENPEVLWIGRRSNSQSLTRNTDELHLDAARLSRLPAGHPQGYQDAFNAFVTDTYAAILGDAPDGLPTFVDGLRAVTITDAVLRSARTGTWTEPVSGDIIDTAANDIGTPSAFAGIDNEQRSSTAS